MKKIIYSLCLMAVILSFAGCSKSEDLENSIDFSLPYNTITVADDPNDSIQHYRYEIYQKYGVPVLFNDTVSKHYVGKDYFGNDVYRYETVDLNWSFTGHGNTKYVYDYVKTPEEKMAALRYAEAYLKVASKPMRPYCIMMANNLTYPDSKNKPYLVNFRTLVLTQFAKYKDSSDSLAKAIINSMVIDRVKANSRIVAQFGSVSSTNNWYGRQFKGDLNCTYKYTAWVWWFSSNEFFRHEVKSIYTLNPANMEYAYKQNMAWFSQELGMAPGDTISEADYEVYCEKVLDDIGQYGFICGAKTLGFRTAPENVDEDITFFLEAILQNGDSLFRARFKQPLVLQKYQILHDYITNTLEVQL